MVAREFTSPKSPSWRQRQLSWRIAGLIDIARARDAGNVDYDATTAFSIMCATASRMMWALSGHVGSAEAALALAHASSRWRGGLVLVLGFSAFGIWRRSVHPPRWIRFFWFVLVIGFAGVGAGIDAITVSISVAIVGAFIFVGTGVVAVALTFPLADMIAVSAIAVFVVAPILDVIVENGLPMPLLLS